MNKLLLFLLLLTSTFACAQTVTTTKIKMDGKTVTKISDDPTDIADASNTTLPTAEAINAAIQFVFDPVAGTLSTVGGNTINIASLSDTAQVLNLNGTVISLSRGGDSIDFAPSLLPITDSVDELESRVDALSAIEPDTTSQIQTIDFDPATGELSLSKGNTVSIPQNGVDSVRFQNGSLTLYLGDNSQLVASGFGTGQAYDDAQVVSDIAANATAIATNTQAIADLPTDTDVAAVGARVDVAEDSLAAIRTDVTSNFQDIGNLPTYAELSAAEQRAKEYADANDAVGSGGGSVSQEYRAIPYSTPLVVPYVDSMANFAVNVTDDISLDVSFAGGQGGGYVDLILQDGDENITFPGTGPVNPSYPTAAGSVLSFEYRLGSDDVLRWYYLGETPFYDGTTATVGEVELTNSVNAADIATIRVTDDHSNAQLQALQIDTRGMRVQFGDVNNGVGEINLNYADGIIGVSKAEFLNGGATLVIGEAQNGNASIRRSSGEIEYKSSGEEGHQFLTNDTEIARLRGDTTRFYNPVVIEGVNVADMITTLIAEVDSLKARLVVVEEATAPKKFRFNIIGASIMNGMVTSQDLAVALKTEFPAADFIVNDFATGGRTATTKAAEIEADLATLPTDDDYQDVFVVHIGGNDVSASRPYSTATAQELSDLTTGIDSIQSAILAAGYPQSSIVIHKLTWRNYDSDLSAQTDEAKGSLPYNDNVIDAFQNAAYAHSDGDDFFDAYTWTYNNYALLTDEVHPTTAGYIALGDFFVSTLGRKIVEDIDPAALVKNTPAGSGSTQIVVDFEAEDTAEAISFSEGINRLTVIDAGSNDFLETSNYTNVSDVTGTATTVDVEVTASRINDVDAFGNAGNTTATINNNLLLSSTLFAGAGNDLVVTFSQLPANTNVTVKLAASRSGTGGRTQTWRVTGGTDVTGYDVQDQPITITTIAGVTDNAGELEIRVIDTNAADFTYLCGVDISYAN